MPARYTISSRTRYTILCDLEFALGVAARAAVRFGVPVRVTGNGGTWLRLPGPSTPVRPLSRLQRARAEQARQKTIALCEGVIRACEAAKRKVA